MSEIASAGKAVSFAFRDSTRLTRMHARAPESFGSEVTHDLAAFKAKCDVIVANRWSDELADVAGKVYMRDLFKRD